MVLTILPVGIPLDFQLHLTLAGLCCAVVEGADPPAAGFQQQTTALNRTWWLILMCGCVLTG